MPPLRGSSRVTLGLPMAKKSSATEAAVFHGRARETADSSLRRRWRSDSGRNDKMVECRWRSDSGRNDKGGWWATGLESGPDSTSKAAGASGLSTQT